MSMSLCEFHHGLQLWYAQIITFDAISPSKGHTDYFDVELYAKNQQIQSLTKQGLFNRSPAAL